MYHIWVDDPRVHVEARVTDFDEATEFVRALIRLWPNLAIRTEYAPAK